MAIWVVFGEKGGVGKTTISVNLAAALAMRREATLLIDTDTEKNALAWLGERTGDLPELTGSYEPKRLVKLGRERFEHTVIDAGGGDSPVLREALLLGDVAVCPFKPSQLDAWKITTVASRIAQARAVGNRKLRAFAVVNGVLPQVQYQDMGVDMRAALETAGQGVWTVTDTILNFRPKQYERAVSAGAGVHEISNAEKAAEEMWSLFVELGAVADAKQEARA